MLSNIDADRIKELCARNDVKRMGVFGSVARGEATDVSDIDLLVEFRERKSLLSLVALERQLTELLGRRVDLLTPGAISPYIRDRVLADLVVIYSDDGGRGSTGAHA